MRSRFLRIWFFKSPNMKSYIVDSVDNDRSLQVIRFTVSRLSDIILENKLSTHLGNPLPHHVPYITKEQRDNANYTRRTEDASRHCRSVV